MKFNHKWIGRAAIAAALFAPLAARAQTPSFSLDADFNTKGSNFYGAGMFLGLPGSGAVSPYIDLYTYYLNYPAGSARGSIHAFNPTVGLSYSTGRSSVNGGIGYAWVSKSAPVPTLNTERGGESGVTASFGAHTTGLSERPYKAEFLGNYNFGSAYLWTRARASVPVGYSALHPSRLGLQIVGQGSNKNGASSHSFSFGPVFETKLSRQLSFSASAGPQFYNHGGSGAYLSLSLGINP